MTSYQAENLSIVIPAKNEQLAIGQLVHDLRSSFAQAQIIVVDDGSTDQTATIAAEAGATVINHPYSKGNGAAIKTGARHASGDFIVFMDGDGQHKSKDIQLLLDKMAEGYDMVVGARQKGSQASVGRGMANKFYNKLASYVTGQKVEDLTSGFRLVRRSLFLKILSLLPNGFSYPTTSTMAFFRAGYSVAYVPINAATRQGKSHIRPLQDGIRFLLIIFKIGTLYSPLKLFLPISASVFAVGLSYYAYTYLTVGRFTNMSALMFTTALIVFMVGLVSEQITQLLYVETEKEHN
ncbi:glycosyltransferase family 2 protein [Rheinheimera sp. 4Y26]|uniref:glycosyltransferase family 2 protein n=1 Tax=Rheinheimera sp. 4Y26 TaxID=2977811 RepID=UPI0021B0A70E|nr:glycosyltransferase family 2 protein [Rheinheimera sp. 4Y26]MCT6698439.1 glycosyltransferase family 2 protein [Rheinheimera sp. 4Y26]